MYFTPEQIANANKAGVETLLGFAGSQFASFERLAVLNFNAAKATFEEGLGRAKALINAKDAQEYFALNTAASQPALERAIAYSRSVYEVAAQSQSELVNSRGGRAGENNKTRVGALERFQKSPPAGSDVAVAAVKSALAAASTAYDNFNKV